MEIEKRDVSVEDRQDMSVKAGNSNEVQNVPFEDLDSGTDTEAPPKLLNFLLDGDYDTELLQSNKSLLAYVRNQPLPRTQRVVMTEKNLPLYCRFPVHLKENQNN